MYKLTQWTIISQMDHLFNTDSFLFYIITHNINLIQYYYFSIHIVIVVQYSVHTDCINTNTITSLYSNFQLLKSLSQWLIFCPADDCDDIISF